MSDFKVQLIADDGTLLDLEGEMNVGRTLECDVCVDNPGVSRKHAIFQIEGERVSLKDLGSANGTRVNGERISALVELHNGDVIMFEDSRFTISIQSTADPAGEDDNRTIIRTDTLIRNDPPASSPAPDPRPVQEPEPVPEPAPIQKPEPESEVATSLSSTPADSPDSNAQPAAPQSQRSKDIPAAWMEDDDGEQTQFLAAVGTGEARAPQPAMRERASDLAHLVIQPEGGGGYVLELEVSGGSEPDVWELGRSPGSQILIEEPSVSARHAQMIHQSGRWRIVNLVSSNGIFVNGEKKLNAFLSDGDELKLGLVTISFRAAASGHEKFQSAIRRRENVSNTPQKSGKRNMAIIGGVVVVVLIAAAAAVALLG